MSKHSIALQELAGTWLVDQQTADLAFRKLIEHGADVDSTARPPERMFGFIGVGNIATQMGITNIPETAGIMVIAHEGLMYDFHARWIEQDINWAAKTDNILGVVLSLNCPGAPEHSAYRVYDALMRLKKPKMAYCDHGIMGSGALLMAMGTDRIVASRHTDEIGSIGAYATFRDANGYWEKQGYIVKDVYAPQSTEKNLAHKEAQKGNFKPLAASLKQKAADFISLVESRRPNLKETKAGDPLKGGLFSATETLEMGIIDAIEPLDLSIQNMLTLLSEDLSTLNSDNTMFGYIKIPALLAVQGVAPDKLTEDQMKAINAELTAAGFTHLAVVSKSEFETSVENATKLTQLTTERDTLKTQLSAQPDQTELNNLKTQLSTITTERDTLKAQVATLGVQPGAAPTVVPTQSDPATPAATAQLTAEQIIANLEHNKALENNPLFM